MDFSVVDEALEGAVGNGTFPGVVVLVDRDGETLYRKAFGLKSVVPCEVALVEDTVFDLASLTKPLATTIALMRFVAEKKVKLDDKISRFFPNFGVHGKNSITIRQLLSHSSGLPAWQPYYEDLAQKKRGIGQLATMASQSAREFIYAQLQREKVLFEPGTGVAYSDLGFMLLGALVEDVSGMGLDQYCWEKIYRPLGLKAIGFINLETLRRKKLEPATEMIAATEDCPWRKRILCGEVHDDNAYAMGGVAGHAGLFAPVDDVHCLISELIHCYYGDSNFLPQSVVREFWTQDGRVPGSSWALGWDTPSSQGSTAGDSFSTLSVGHLGFTGTSMWVDVKRKIQVIVLSNRVHPTRKNEKLSGFRPILHDALMKVVLDGVDGAVMPSGRTTEPTRSTIKLTQVQEVSEAGPIDGVGEPSANRAATEPGDPNVTSLAS